MFDAVGNYLKTFGAFMLLVGQLEGCWRDADLHMAQLMPLPLTVSCFSKIQLGSGTGFPG